MANRVVDYKRRYGDKWEGHRPNKANWMSNDYSVSPNSLMFHSDHAYVGYVDGTSGSYGINKKTWLISSQGINFDGNHVGKNEEA